MADDDGIPTCKVVLIGNSGTGKTTLIHRWISGVFLQSMNPTIGSGHRRTRATLENGDSIALIIWDTAGQEQFHSLLPLYTRSSSLAIVVASVDDLSSYESIPKWLQIVEESCVDKPPFVLLINKMDLEAPKGMTVEKVHTEWDDTFAAIFFVSAKTGENCDQVIPFVAREAAAFLQALGHTEVGARIDTVWGKKRCC
jgi:small GTP-binding protein